MQPRTRIVIALAWVGACFLPSAPAWADSQANPSGGVVEKGTPGPLSLAQADPAPAANQESPVSAQAPTTRAAVEEAPAKEEPALPISLGVSYYLLSDYVWRGINLSEYDHEGREKPNHQVTSSIDWDTGDFGTVGFDTFWEWYAAQHQLNPTTGQNLQEIDYVIRWGYDLKPISTGLTLGYSFYTFPKLARVLRQDKAIGNNNDDRDQEWWFKLDHNDAWLWKWLLPQNEEGVLNPNFLLAQGTGIGAGHVWMEAAVSHAFRVAENLTLTPGYLVAMDGGVLRRYLGRSHADTFRLAYDQWSLNATYDLTPILHLPKWAGTLSLSGLLYYNNALGTAEDEGSIDDILYGGMSVNWAWGG